MGSLLEFRGKYLSGNILQCGYRWFESEILNCFVQCRRFRSLQPFCIDNTDSCFLTGIENLNKETVQNGTENGVESLICFGCRLDVHLSFFGFTKLQLI